LLSTSPVAVPPGLVAVDIDGYAGGGGGIIRRTVPAPPSMVSLPSRDQRIIARAAGDRVATHAAVDHVIARATFQRIRVGAAGDGAPRPEPTIRSMLE
jgi:hypothetical protein